MDASDHFMNKHDYLCDGAMECGPSPHSYLIDSYLNIMEMK
jgi:hypothetical protein